VYILNSSQHLTIKVLAVYLAVMFRLLVNQLLVQTMHLDEKEIMMKMPHLSLKNAHKIGRGNDRGRIILDKYKNSTR
jgi:hypothetical protein